MSFSSPEFPIYEEFVYTTPAPKDGETPYSKARHLKDNQSRAEYAKKQALGNLKAGRDQIAYYDDIAGRAKCNERINCNHWQGP